MLKLKTKTKCAKRFKRILLIYLFLIYSYFTQHFNPFNPEYRTVQGFNNDSRNKIKVLIPVYYFNHKCGFIEY